MQTPSHPLLSTETADITEFLTDGLFAALPADEAHLAEPLRTLRETVWPKGSAARVDGHRLRDGRMEAAAETAGLHQEIIREVPAPQRAIFMEQLARMGHLRQLASLVARDNFLQRHFTARGETAPGTGADFILHSDRPLVDLLEAINGVVFNPVFTAHPTNNNALLSMQALGEVGSAVTRFRLHGGNESDVLQALRDYAQQPVTPMDGEEDRNLSVAEETGNILHFLREIYHQLPTILSGYDAAFETRFGAAYDPLSLRPDYRFDAWGSSGDKDGNKLVNATTTLEALIQHRQMGAALLAEALENILAEALPEPDRTALSHWHARMTEAKLALYGLHAEYDAAVDEAAFPERAGQLPDDSFDGISKRLAALYRGEAGFDAAVFEAAVAVAYRRTTDVAQALLLGLLRNLRIFGFGFGRIEYRETAEEFGRVAKLLLGGEYPLMTAPEMGAAQKLAPPERREKMQDFLKYLPEDAQAAILSEEAAEKFKLRIMEANQALENQRASALTACLQDKARLAVMRARMEEITAQGVHRAYGDSPYPIAYQTIKRMQLARDFPESIVKQVLAECQGPSNALEAILMMEMAAADGRKPVLGVVPLFEDPEILDTAQAIMRTIVTNPVYAAQMRTFQQAHPKEALLEEGVPLLTQEVQFAHSDNGRRGGVPAARAYIYKAHEDLQKLGRELGMAFTEFHGGSASDPYRGGTRSYIGMIRDYGLQDHFKITLQGGDLLNIFNYEGSIQRYLDGVLQYCARQRLKRERRVSSRIDRMARTALMGTLKDYQKRVFKNLGIGALFGALADVFDLGSGAIGSRQQRAGVGFGHSESREGDSTFLDPDTVRTITFSELLQHNQINPTWVGALELSNNIRAVCAKGLPKAIEELQKLELSPRAGPNAKPRFLRAMALEQQKTELRARIKTARARSKPPSGTGMETDLQAGEADALKKRIAQWKSELSALRNPAKFSPDRIAGMTAQDFYASIRGIHPGVVQYMYQRSPAFRDVMDRMAFGIVTSSLDAVERHHHAELDANPQARSFLRTLQLEYVKAATLVHAALTGRYPESTKPPGEERPTEYARKEGATAQELSNDPVPDLDSIRAQTLALPRLRHLKRDVEDNMALLDFINSFKDRLRHEFQTENAELLHELRFEPSSDAPQTLVRIGRTSIPVSVKTRDVAGLRRAMGNYPHDRYAVQFEISHQTPRPDGMSASYLVRFGDAATGPAFALPHDQWIRLREECMADGRRDETQADLDRARRHLFRLVHTAADTATHVYYPTAGDRAYGQARAAAEAVA